MKVFVSYARADNDEAALHRIDALVEKLLHDSKPYLDDLHHGREVDRHEAVESAFHASTAFVAVLSPWYRRTEWTEKEYLWAVTSGIAMFSLNGNELTPLNEKALDLLLRQNLVAA